MTGWVITPKVDEVFRKYHFKLSNINYLNLKHRYNSLIKNTRGIQVKNFSLNNQSEFYSINIIIKASTLSMLSSLNLCFNSFIKKNEYSSQIKYYILKQEVGPVNKNDVFLTNSSKKKTIILSFVNNKKSKLTLNELNVCLIEHDIIYKITEDLNEYLKKIIFNLDRCNLTYSGEAVVIQLFKINKKYQLLGCSLINGFFEENKKIEVLRNGVSLFKGVEIQRIEYLNRRVINTKAVQGNFCLKVLNNNVCINDIIKCL
ncbi:hypothetical protein E5P55_00300 [Candidatus Pinguicoccus supinus]|uniref:Translation initiation factor IF- 2 domain-containing protein n=1 Tax=Candidatus Pinguicoccus supinus TaxID=2529394 RepID=A0A7T0BRI1_9BACT|nr:hypothetical protein E5P55_00300 [Candidatus Pinguicoccus supinus]